MPFSSGSVSVHTDFYKPTKRSEDEVMQSERELTDWTVLPIVILQRQESLMTDSRSCCTLIPLVCVFMPSGPADYKQFSHYKAENVPTAVSIAVD